MTSVVCAQPNVWPLRRRVLKRCVDVLVASVAILLLAPLYLVLGLAVLASSGRPILYRWDVVGLDGRPFTGWKFRTMVPNADELRGELLDHNEMTGPVFKLRRDPRVTRLGRVLRRYSLDELPQLWSVVKGDMSIVGPRPSFPHEYEALTPDQRRRLSVKPGITCLWQVEGRSTLSDFDRWIELDLLYIDEWSPLVDLKIMLRTALVVLAAKGAW